MYPPKRNRNTSRKVFHGLFTITALLLIAALSSCSPQQTSEAPKTVSKDLVQNAFLRGVRLGDGVPLSLNLYVRWRINDVAAFEEQFDRPTHFDSLILHPREYELAANVAHSFPSVDSVFTVDRQAFIDEVKNSLLAELGEEGITIKEVIVSDLVFPQTFTDAMEKVALNERELERIRQQKLVDLAEAEARKERAESEGLIAIAEAQAEGELQKITAQTEQSRRATEVARAETEAQLTEKRAEADAKRIELLAAAEREKLAELNKIDVQKRRDLDLAEMDKRRAEQELEVEKIRGLDQLETDKELELARICMDNPAYASFLVNRELASKVQIAVLPSGTDANIFGDLFKNGLATNANK